MGKPAFFEVLKTEGKLSLVEPNKNISGTYFKKSTSHLESARLLLKENKLEEAVSLTYYSMYYAVQALFFEVGLKCENHSASIILLSKVFGIDNSQISDAKKERIDKQYYVDFKVTKDDVKELIRTAESFNSTILDFVSRLDNRKINEHRNQLQKILCRE